MNHPKEKRLQPALAWIALVGAWLTACGQPEQGGAAAGPEQAPPPSNRIDVPLAVRKNLGIEFVQVERRQIQSILRIPAQVELLPSATQHYRAPLGGRVSLEVDPLQAVEPGDLLYTLDSHEWRDLQRELGAVSNKHTVTKAQFAAMTPLTRACEQHEASLRNALAVTRGYVKSLERAEKDVGGQGAKLATARIEESRIEAQIAEASEKHTETQTRTKELAAMLVSQREQIDLLISGAAATLGVDRKTLASTTNGEAGWRELTTIEVRAVRPGIVDQIAVANGNLVEAYGAVITTIEPGRVRCHARALQSDLGLLRDGLRATIVPAGAVDTEARVAATIQLGPSGDPSTRTLDVFAAPTEADLRFVRPGLAVFLEIITKSTEGNDLAIPKSCVLPDGLDRVFFRRDPKDKDKVIRIVGDFGEDDGMWIEVKSGIMDGDEIVMAGAFELVLASSNQSIKGGHFHADGTWHADGEDHE